jgi:hypothetical protein
MARLLTERGILMAMHRTASALAALTLMAACGGASAEQLRARAAFDLNCPDGEIAIVHIDDRTEGVRGCGQRVTYVENCAWADGYGGKHDCTWILNTDARRKKSEE